LERYARLLRNTKRILEAQKLESRAGKIRFKMALKKGSVGWDNMQPSAANAIWQTTG
jgi:hypothetical protein